MNIILGNIDYCIDKNTEQYNSLYREYCQSSLSEITSFIEAYREANDLKIALTLFEQTYIKCIEKYIEKSCRTLYERNVLFLTDVQFAEKYESFISIDSVMEPLTDALAALSEYTDDLNLKSELAKMRRGHWEGGGYGLRGAVKGALTATALNAAGGVVYSISDAFKAYSNNLKLEDAMWQIYDDERTISCMCYAIHTIVIGCFYGLIDELIDHNCMVQIKTDVTAAERISTNALKYDSNAQDKANHLIEALLLDPYNSDIYASLKEHAPETKGLSHFCKEFSSDIFENIDAELDTFDKWKKVSRLPEKDAYDIAEKLICYIKLGTNENHKYSSEISSLGSDLVIKCSKNPDSIYTILARMKEKLPSAALHEISDLTVKLNEIYIESVKKQVEAKRASDLSKISSMPDLFPEEISAKLSAYGKYAKDYNTDVSSHTDQLLIRFASKDSAYDNLHHMHSLTADAPSNLKKSIESTINAINAKNIISALDKRIYCNTIYVFSPQLLDIVKEARLGNPSAQLWLKTLFFSPMLMMTLRDGILSENINERNSADQIIKLIKNTVKIIFDRCDISSFDKYMDICLSYICGTDKSIYIEALGAFEFDNNCPCGMYEYGKELIQAGANKNGIGIIKKAASLYYKPAISYLAENKSDDNSENIYYTILSKSAFNHYSILKFDTEAFDTNLSVTVKHINRLITGQAFFDDNETEKLTKYMVEAFEDFNVESKYDNYTNIGYWCGDFGDKLLLTSAKMSFKFDKKEKALLSISKNDNKQEYIFTNTSFKWRLDSSVYSSSLADDIFADIHRHIPSGHGKGGIIYNLYLYFYYVHKGYSRELSVETLEKMAFCGHPAAICRLLSDPEYIIGEEKRVVWTQIKNKWEATTYCQVKCPDCSSPRPISDKFCTVCGTKLR